MNPLVALLQFQIRLGRPEENFARAAEAAQQAAENGCQLLLLPELWSSGYDLPNRAAYAEENTRLLPRLHALAQQHQLWIAGSILTQRSGKFFNTLHCLSPDPLKASFTYDKLHPFPLMQEDVYLTPGAAPVLADLNWASAGCAVCYDLRFPELFRYYALSGANLFLLPAEWPQARVENWRTLIRARAIENQSFMLACNAVQQIGGERFGGFSAVIAPNGDILAEADGSSETLLITELDFTFLADHRQQIPVFANRRADLFGS